MQIENLEFINNNLFSFFHKFEPHSVESSLISSFFKIQICIDNCGPSTRQKYGALGQVLKNFHVYLIHMNFLRNQTKKIYNRVKEQLYCDANIFVFRYVIVFWSKKRWKLKNNLRLPTLSYFLHTRIAFSLSI